MPATAFGTSLGLPPEFSSVLAAGTLRRESRRWTPRPPCARGSALVIVSVVGSSAVLEVQGADRLWSLRSRLEVPLAHIMEARPAPPEMPGWTDWLALDGVKIAGAHLPGVIAAGTFYHRDGWVFWDVHDPSRAVEIQLRDERYARLVVEVENRAATIALLNSARR